MEGLVKKENCILFQVEILQQRRPVKMDRKTSIFLFIGLALIVISIILGFVLFPKLLNDKIRQTVRLVEGEDTFKKWRHAPIPIYMKVYFFNVTNPFEVLQGGKPILNQVGPYVYAEDRRKIIENASTENDTVLFRPKITYYFQPQLSVGPEQEYITTVNIVLLSLMKKALKMPFLERYFILLVIKKYNEQLFVRRSIEEMLFKGHYSEILEELDHVTDEIGPEDTTVGLFYGKNGTTKDILEIRAGIHDSETFGETLSWNGKTTLDTWNNQYCNMINGSDGSIFPPFLKKDQKLKIFSTDMCRSLYMNFDREENVLGIPGYRFSTPREVMEDPRTNEENRCYCRDPDLKFDNCFRTGVFPLGPCQKGVPLSASWPHFYNGDPIYLNQSFGLSPDKSIHETFIILEPLSGALLLASKRFQINAELFPTKLIRELKNVSEILLPIMWLDETAGQTEESSRMFHTKLMIPLMVGSISKWAVMCCGTAFIAFSIFLISKRRSQKLKLPEDENSPPGKVHLNPTHVAGKI